MQRRFLKISLLLVLLISFLSINTITVSATPVTDGLVLDHNYMTDSGDTIVDSSGNSNNGTNYGSTVSEYMEGAKRTFDGTTYYDIPLASSLNSNAVTIEVWASNPTFVNYATYVSRGNWGTNHPYKFGIINGKPYSEVRTTDGYNTMYWQFTPVPSIVYQYVLTYDSVNGQKTYVNGVLTAAQAATGAIDTSDAYSIQIGENNNASVYRLRIYDRSLSQNEVVQNYNDEAQLIAPPAPTPTPIPIYNDIVVNKPDGFTWTSAPITVAYNLSHNNLYTNFTVKSYQWTGLNKTYYVDPANGNDNNDGYTVGTSFKNIDKALSMADGDVIYIAPGYYDRANGLGSHTGNGVLELQHSTSLKVLNGGTATFAISDASELTWALTSGKTHTYQASTNANGTVWDAKHADANGDYQQYAYANSIDEVETTAGSWYADTSSHILYVHTSDGRTPDDKIRPYYESITGIYNDGYTLYMENINVEGGYHVISISNGDLYAYNCSYKYNSNGAGVGLTAVNSPHVYLQNCIAAYNAGDGFNYYTSCYALEINCISRNNGITWLRPNQTVDNGSTGHAGSHIIRIGGLYANSNGPNVVDVINTESWNLNCTASGTQVLYNTTSNTGFYIGSGEGTSTMWLDTCKETWVYNPTYTAENGVLYEYSTTIPPVAAFTANTFSGINATKVAFTDYSTGTVNSYLWDFGDGSTSTERNVTHDYQQGGAYQVSLTVTNDGGSNKITHTINVEYRELQRWDIISGDVKQIVYLLLIIPLAIGGIFVFRLFSGEEVDTSILMKIGVIGIALIIVVMILLKVLEAVSGVA